MFRQYYPTFCRIALGYVREYMVVEEIVNDVFVRFWNNQSQMDVRDSLKSYLFKSVQNVSVDYLRANCKRKQHTSYYRRHTTLAYFGENPLDYIISDETEQKIMKAAD
ncbi:MAG: hypothetical protein LBV41_12910 [Cytophagaceae bacterium]|nr:hypothetical protein [Cytophagaceae bacterium]